MQLPMANLVARDEDGAADFTPTMRGLLITLVVLGFVALFLAGGLYMMKQVRKRNRRRDLEAELPIYERGHSRASNTRSLTVRTSRYSKGESLFVVQEKADLIANSDSPPPSPLPEIRITFPEEVDDFGKRQSGRVVVVRVGEHSVGLEPYQGDLPPYQQSDSDRFQSLDLDRIGGLKEKDMRYS